jgi:HAD superfamily hydrolase (TIGR01509 family)
LKVALLFDLDGTLADTDDLHLAAFRSAFAPFGVALDKEQYRHLIMGASNAAIGEAFLSHLPVATREAIIAAKEAAFRDSFQTAQPTKGLVALLDFADARKFPCAVVTNAPRANANLMLTTLGLADRLPRVVVGAELERSKPDPLPYQTALRLASVDAQSSVAFEDSLSGVRSAAAAGLAVVGLTTGLDASTLIAAGAAFAAADFTDQRIYDLIAGRADKTARSDATEKIA